MSLILDEKSSSPFFLTAADIGGSIRSPASLCGLYGLRLTAMRIPVAGCRSYVPGRDSVLGSFGPLAQSLRDVELFARVVIESKPWKTDPSLLELEWRLGRTGGWEDGSRKLRVGIMRSDGEVRPLPPIVRAMEAVEQRLAGSDRIEIVEFVPFHFRKGWEIVRKLVRFISSSDCFFHFISFISFDI